MSWIPSGLDFFLQLVQFFFYVPAWICYVIGTIGALLWWRQQSGAILRGAGELSSAIRESRSARRRSYPVRFTLIGMASIGLVFVVNGILRIFSALVQYAPIDNASGHQFLPARFYPLLGDNASNEWIVRVTIGTWIFLFIYLVGELVKFGFVQAVGSIISGVATVAFIIIAILGLLILVLYLGALATHTAGAVADALPVFAVAFALSLVGAFLLRWLQSSVIRLAVRE